MNFSINRLFTASSLLAIIFLSLPLQAETISLNSAGEGGSGVFSAALEKSSCAKVAVVMFHGRGHTATGPVVEELRLSLNRAGYTTLSLENPKPLNDQVTFAAYLDDVNNDNYVFPEAYARMRTALNYLQAQGVEQVVIGGFSLGNRLATAYVARGQIDELPVTGLIGVGMYANYVDPLNIALTLDEVTVPVLDIYGDLDSNAATTAVSRVEAYSAGTGQDYTQTPLSCINGTNCHQLEGLKGNDTMPLELNVNAWMQAFAPAALVTGCTPEEPSSSGGGGSISACFSLLLLSMLSLFRLSGFRFANDLK